VKNRLQLYFGLATVLAILGVLFTRAEPPGTTFSAPAFGVAAAAAAAIPTTSSAPSPAPAPATSAAPAPAPQGYVTPGPASTKGDGGTPAASTAVATPNVAAAATSGETWDVRHTPSVDAAAIRQVLQRYNSPAVGAADAMYNLGVEYGIDPAFCLAFFINESTAGTAGVARTTKSVGNIRTTAGYADYQGYRKYDSWEQGIEDWYRLIRDLYIGQWDLTTVDQIIPVYAPTFDSNNPDHYASTVKKLVGVWRGAH
jgi:hypothetical protein